jgi:hypothetical protein
VPPHKAKIRASLFSLPCPTAEGGSLHMCLLIVCAGSRPSIPPPTLKSPPLSKPVPGCLRRANSEDLETFIDFADMESLFNLFHACAANFSLFDWLRRRRFYKLFGLKTAAAPPIINGNKEEEKPLL